MKFRNMIFAFFIFVLFQSCSSSTDNNQTGDLVVVIPKTVSLNGIDYDKLEIGLYPIYTDYKMQSAIDIKKISNGEVRFNGIVPGTYIAAVAVIPSESIVRTYKTVQVVGGQTKTYNLF